MRLSQKTKSQITRVALRIGGKLIQLIGTSLRLNVHGWTRIQALLENGKPLIFQVWHGDMFIFWYLISPLRPAAIVSQAKDGDIAAAILEGLNFKTFRGSSTRGGKKAYTDMIRYLRKRQIKVSGFASDGPRGPFRVMKAGTVVAAQHLDAYIIPSASFAKWTIRGRGWDKFAFPLPFSKAVAVFGEPIKVDPTLKGEALNQALTEISERCKQHQEATEKLFQ